MEPDSTRRRGGRPKGAKNKKTLAEQQEKEATRQVVRDMVKKRVKTMIAAQISSSEGIKYLVVREKKSGKFKRVSEAMARARQALTADEEIIEVWEKDPSIQAFTDLMNRVIDKPKEQEQEIKLSGSVDLIATLNAGRQRAANAKKLEGARNE